MKKRTQILAVLLSFILSSAYLKVNGATYYSVADGNWSSTSTWSTSSGGASGAGPPSNNDIVHVETDVILDTDVSNPGISLHVSSSGSLTKKSTGGPYGIYLKTNGTLDIQGDVDIDELNVKNGVKLNIHAGATVNVTDLLTGKGSSKTITVNGDLTAGTIEDLSVTGTGSVTATTYSGFSVGGSYNIYGTDNPTNGTTYYGQSWLGTSTTAWETAGNWASNEVPDDTIHVQIHDKINDPIIASDAKCNDLIIESNGILTINAGHSLTVSGDFTNNGTLTLKSSSSGTASIIISGTKSGSGTINIERYLTGSKYHYVGSQFSNETVSSIEGTVYTYDETNSDSSRDEGWTLAQSTDVMTPGKGYATYIGTTQTKTLNGNLNNSDIQITISYTSSSPVNASSSGWNLLSNPYPAAIDASSFTTLNSTFDGSLYFWDDDGSGSSGFSRDSDYGVWTSSSQVAADGGGQEVAPDGSIAVGQGFFVKRASSDTATVKFRKSMLETNTTQFFVPNEESKSACWINLTNPYNSRNEISIAFMPDATFQKDRQYDALKLRGNPSIAFYSMSTFDENEYIIQTLPPITSSLKVPVGFYTRVAGTHKIKLEDVLNHDESTEIYLHDMHDKVSYKLNLDEPIEFHSHAGEFNDRFIIHFVNTTNNIHTNSLESNIIVSSIDKNVIINNKTEGNVSFSFINSDGKQLIRSHLNTGDIYHSPELTPGIYLVKFNLKENIFTKKVIIF